MKKNKIIPLLIAIILPILATAFIVSYSYGWENGWVENKNNFLEDYFKNDVETLDQIERSVKYRSNSYIKSVGDITFSSYNPDGESVQYTETATDGITYKDGTFIDPKNVSITPYAYTITDVDGDESIIYSFYIHGIQYTKDDTEVTPNTVYMIFVEGIGEEADENLKELLEKVETEGVPGATQSNNPSVNGVVANKVDQIFDKHATVPPVEEDEDEIDYFVWSLSARGGVDGTDFADLKDATFAFYTTKDTEDDELVSELDFVVTGTYSNILKTGTAFNKLNGVLPGFNNDLENAGYLSFVWPTLLWQGAIAFVLSGALGYAFYYIWTTDESLKMDTTVLKNNAGSKNKQQPKNKNKK